MAGFNVDNAVAFAHAHTDVYENGRPKPRTKSAKRCAHYVVDAITSPAGGGIPLGRADAKYMGANLEAAGFREVDPRTPQKGDVAVIQPCHGTSKYGHVCIFDGKSWVSDFEQRPGDKSPYPGDSYRDGHAAYKVYRYQGQGQASSGTGVQGTTVLGTKLGKAEGLVFIGPEQRELSHQLAELQGGGKVIRCNRTVFVGRKRLPAACVNDETTDGPITIGEDSVQMA